MSRFAAGAAIAALIAGGVYVGAPFAAAETAGPCPSSPSLPAPVVTASATSDGSGVRFSWAPVPGAARYEERHQWEGVGADGRPYRGPNEDAWNPVLDPAAGVTVTPPADAGNLVFRIRAVDACGASPEAQWTGPAQRLAAPREVSAFPGRTTLLVSWIPGHPRSAPNYADAPYVVTVNPGGRTCSVARDQPNNCTVNGLTTGKRYTVSVQGSNTLGPGAIGSLPVPVQLAVGPTPPRQVRAVTGLTTARVSWTPPRNSGGPSIKRYLVASDPGGRTCRSASLSCTVSGLTPGTAYRFIVVADNGTVIGFPGRSAVVSTTAPPPVPQPSPTPTESIKPPQNLG